MPLRIIGGDLKGRKLKSVPGLATRPTADRTREAIFNILGSTVRDAQVLDLFAGTGAYGIEAISRGARGAVFIEIGREPFAALTANILACDLQDRTVAIRWDVVRNLNCLRNQERPFQIAFMDPPYHQSLLLPTLSNLHAAHCLVNGARLVVEHGVEDQVPEASVPYRLQGQRRYGKTLVSFLTYVI